MRSAPPLLSSDAEWLLWACLLLAALIPTVRWVVSLRRPAQILAFLALAAGLWGAVSWKQQQNLRSLRHAEFAQLVPSEGRPGGYVSSDQCRSCHPNEHQSWHNSFHRTMTQVAAPATVLARFDVGSLSLEGETYRLEKRGDEFWVEMPDPEWSLQTPPRPDRNKPFIPPVPAPRVWRQLGLLTGSHHMQVYWVTGSRGNLQHVFPFCWIVADQRWVPVRDTFLRDPHLAPYSQRWNNNCIRCHATGGQPLPDPQSGLMSTRTGELGIACEACHGPAERHVAHYRNPVQRYARHLGGEPEPTIVNPARLPKKESSQACGQCHGIKWIPAAEQYERNGFSYRPGDDLDRTTPIVRPSRLDLQEFLREPLRRQPRFLDEHYWSDGEVRVSGREFNGLVDSPCYERGDMSCLSCHSMHSYPSNDDQFAPGRHGDAACIQCHSSIAAQGEAHTHHARNSPGSACMNCHMPHTTYGLLKAIRSHRISNPDVSSTLATGRPNACNLCHLDRPLSWTAEKLTAWYGAQSPEIPAEHQSTAAGALWSLKGDAGQRALVAWHMGWDAAKAASGADWLAPYLSQALDDPYAAVRYIAARSLRSLPEFASFSYDYVGPPAHRSEAATRSFEVWEQQTRPQPPGSDRSAVLLQADGRWMKSTADRLRSERNLRSMDLQE